MLRCIAVLLVIARHEYPQTRVGNAGWVGVDLFFVLSGFLISGLLFAEYKSHRSIDWKRFFIRRGLKLYPAFYVFLFATFLVQFGSHQIGGLSSYLGEVFYVQNYGPYIWNHTWSLAVEEHFYILLPAFLLLLVRFSSDRANPFRMVAPAFLFVAIACLVSRIATVMVIPAGQLRSWLVYRPIYVSTHNRMDSLFFGVLLGYLYHFWPRKLAAAFSTKRKSLALSLLAAALLSCCLIVPIESPFMLTMGFTLLYVGFGIVLMLCLHVRGVLPKILERPTAQAGAGLAYTGMYSYSIYLWHGAVLVWLPNALRRITWFETAISGNKQLRIALSVSYVVISITLGILMSRLVEYPVLHLRDRLFPFAQSPISAQQSPP